MVVFSTITCSGGFGFFSESRTQPNDGVSGSGRTSTTTSSLAFLRSQNEFWHTLLVVLSIAGTACLPVTMKSVATLMMPPDSQGFAFAALSVCTTVGVMVGNIIGTRVYARTRDDGSPWSMALPFLIAAVIIMFSSILPIAVAHNHQSGNALLPVEYHQVADQDHDEDGEAGSDNDTKCGLDHGNATSDSGYLRDDRTLVVVCEDGSRGMVNSLNKHPRETKVLELHSVSGGRVTDLSERTGETFGSSTAIGGNDNEAAAGSEDS